MQALPFLSYMVHALGVNVFSYDYSGYGASSGSRSESDVYADAEAALEELQTRLHVPLDRIVLHGTSIGTAPTVHLASKLEVVVIVVYFSSSKFCVGE